MRTFHYIGRTPVDLDDGKGTKLTLLPGGLYAVDEKKDAAKIKLLKTVSKDELLDRTPPAPRVLEKIAAPKPAPPPKPSDKDKPKGKDR